MTPEERANKVVADWEPGTMRPLIAAAIRAAENDVLKRAATFADKLPRGASFSDEFESGHDQACDRIAEGIRGMMHP